MELKQYVTINPPLTCTLEGGGEGSICSLANNGIGLLIDGAVATDTLTIRFTLGDRDFRIHLLPERQLPNGMMVATGSSADDRDQLRDLLSAIRKDQHISICADRDVEARRASNGLENFYLQPMALPELDWEDLDTAVTWLGRKFDAPLLITGMTGGVSRGETINRRLAEAAAAMNIPMGVGSQRLALENQELKNIFHVKKFVPDVFLIGNIGLAQLANGSVGVDQCQRAVEMIGADAFAIHVNVLQECIQSEGDRRFRGALSVIESLCQELSVPIVVKEVGCGIDLVTARRLADCGVTTIDVGGRGGTSWSAIEGMRAMDPLQQNSGENFRDWGIATAFSLAKLRKELPDLKLIGTGGIRNGLDVAKVVALGGSFAGIGLPLMRAALADEQGPLRLLEQYEHELRTAMICSGVRELAGLGRVLRWGEPYLAECRAMFSDQLPLTIAERDPQLPAER